MVAPTTQEKPQKCPEVVICDQVPPCRPRYVVAEEKWGKKNLILATIGFFFCNLLGLPALIMAIFSYVDHGNKQFAESAKKSRRARRLSIAAICVGTLLLLALMLAYYYCPEHQKRREHRRPFGNDGIRVPDEEMLKKNKGMNAFMQKDLMRKLMEKSRERMGEMGSKLMGEMADKRKMMGEMADKRKMMGEMDDQKDMEMEEDDEMRQAKALPDHGELLMEEADKMRQFLQGTAAAQHDDDKHDDDDDDDDRNERDGDDDKHHDDD